MKKIYTTFFITCAAFQLCAQITVSTVVDSTAFKFTDDLIFDAAGNLYCADYGGDKVFKRTPAGDLSIFVSGLNTPNGLAFDSQGNLFICDNVGNRIYKVDANGNFLDTFQVSYPSGILKDVASDTMIFTTYGAQSTVQKLSPAGTISPFHSGSPLNGPVGLEYCAGSLYLANFDDRKIFRVEADTLVFVAQLPGSGSLGFITCVDNKLFATAFQQHKIYRVDPISATVELFAGSTSGQVNGPLSQATFSSPNGIVANAAGDTMYVSQYPSGKLRMITGYSLGISEKEMAGPFVLYPNPAVDFLTVDIQADYLPCTLALITLDGKIVHTERIVEKGQLDVRNLQPGILIVRVDAGVKGIFTERVLRTE